MARISRTIEVAEPVDVVSERWAEFERTPRHGIDAAVSRVRWRAEVLTLEPAGDATRLTLRIDYDEASGDVGLARSVERALEGFRSFLAERRGAGWHGLAPQGSLPA